MMSATAKINMGRIGVAMRGQKGTAVVCWPHADAIKNEDGIALFQIKPDTKKPCAICTGLQK